MSVEDISTPGIEPTLRCVQAPGALGACLITGTDKIRDGYGNGDAFLLDFRHGVFAVADATERFPWSSRRLLNRLAFAFQENGTPGNAIAFRHSIQSAWLDQQYNYKTTLSCVALEPRENAVICHVFNGGDSLVLVVDAADGAIVYHSRPDMNFAGRTRQLPEVTSLGITDDDFRILLVSDGFQDVVKRLGCASGFVPVALVADPPDQIGGRVRAVVLDPALPPLEHDDIAVVLIHPGRLRGRHFAAVIVGGTTPGEEAAYRDYAEQNEAAGLLAPEAWGRQREAMTRVGIRTIP